MDYEQILYTVEDGIATITLNRPDKRNAVTRQMAREVKGAIEEARNDPSVRVLVFTAAGKTFCGGVDLVEREKGQAVTMPPEGSVLQSLAGGLEWALRHFYKPTVAVVNGPAIGMGCDLALMADFRIASEKASFAESYVRLGMLPSAGAWLLPRIVGLTRANQILLLGEPFDAKQAHEWGVVYKIVPHDDLQEEGRAFAAELAAQSPTSMQFLKEAIWLGLNTDLESILRHITYGRTCLELSEDYQEGVRAFLQKRAPKYTGRRRKLQ